MDIICRLAFGLLITLLLSSCGDIESTWQHAGGIKTEAAIALEACGSPSAKQSVLSPIDLGKSIDLEEKLPKSAFKTVEWTDLMPKEDLEAFLNPPSYITDVEEGSFEDQISDQVQSALAAASDDRYQQALVSTSVVSEMDGQPIRIPGFIVPLEFDDEQTITQFFLVPFFGACIHVPPPPPNQIVFVEFPEGLTLEALYDPFWISGILKTVLIENEIATAAYSLRMQHFEEYTY